MVETFDEDIMMRENKENPLHLRSLNHISIIVDVIQSKNLFVFTKMFSDSSLLLFNYGIGIHLLQSDDSCNPIVRVNNPRDNHMSFQCESMATVERKLKEMQIEHVKNTVIEGGISVDQLFFHDPDGLMIEICDCDNLPVIPLKRDLSIQLCPRVNCNL